MIIQKNLKRASELELQTSFGMSFSILLNIDGVQNSRGVAGYVFEL